MVTSPEPAGTPRAAAVSLADIALDGMREAVLIVNSRQRDRPVLFANLAARRLLLRAGAREDLVGSSLYDWLGVGQSAAVDGPLSSISKLSATLRAGIAWRLDAREETLNTEFLLLDSAPGRRLVMLRFAPATPQPGRRAVIDRSAAQLFILDANLKITFAGGPARAADSRHTEDPGQQKGLQG